MLKGGEVKCGKTFLYFSNIIKIIRDISVAISSEMQHHTEQLNHLQHAFYND